jgi:hypothetical protein
MATKRHVKPLDGTLTPFTPNQARRNVQSKNVFINQSERGKGTANPHFDSGTTDVPRPGEMLKNYDLVWI